MHSCCALTTPPGASPHPGNEAPLLGKGEGCKQVTEGRQDGPVRARPEWDPSKGVGTERMQTHRVAAVGHLGQLEAVVCRDNVSF